MHIDPFIGTWQLDPSKSNYELGEPPATGWYRLEATETGYLITMAWTTQAGQAMEMAYEGTPDGKVYPYADSDVVDAISMTRVSAVQLNSASFMAGQQIAHAARIMSEDGRVMTVVQSGNRTDGTLFQNTAVYRKQN